jgi:ATP-binding cassette, subfamily C, bacterial LapB
MSAANFVAEPKPRFAAWLTEPMRRNRATYTKVALAAAMINLFGLVTSLFTMTVYDRVVPNNALSSLVALSLGLAVVVVFDFILRILRGYFVDLAGTDIDHDIGERVFDRLVRIRLDLKKGSTGGLASMMRELETLRDFFASATMTAVVDVPFILVTLVFIALIGGAVVWVPIAAIPIVIGAGWLTRPALDRLSTRSMNQGQLKQTVLVEAIGALEMVKASGAAPLLGERWKRASEAHSDSSLRQRLVSNVAVTVAASANTLAYAGVVIVGVFLIADHKMTTGALVACSILAGRAVQPLSQIASLLARLSATQAAYKQLDAGRRRPHARAVRRADRAAGRRLLLSRCCRKDARRVEPRDSCRTKGRADRAGRLGQVDDRSAHPRPLSAAGRARHDRRDRHPPVRSADDARADRRGLAGKHLAERHGAREYRAGPRRG